MRIREYRGPKNGVLSKESNFSSLYSHFFAREYTRFENTPDLEKGESETQVQSGGSFIMSALDLVSVKLQVNSIKNILLRSFPTKE